jgi:hypothetical protein
MTIQWMASIFQKGNLLATANRVSRAGMQNDSTVCE